MQARHDPSRRHFLATTSGALLGAGLAGGSENTTGSVRSVIHLFMDGGMNHLETFDPKPGNPSMATCVPGVFVGRNLVGIARRMDRITIVRSMGHNMLSHEAARAECMAFPNEWIFKTPSSPAVDGFGRLVREAGLLAAAGEPFLRVELGGWDTHTEGERRTAELSLVLDEALSSLIDDLASRGALGRTLIVVSTEFGRSARANAYGGSNHHPHAYSCVLAGAGCGRGVIGGTSADGMEVIGDAISPAQLIAMIAARIG